MFVLIHFFKPIIITSIILCLSVASPARADDVYQSNTDYTIYIPDTGEYKICDMPPNTIYPYVGYSHQVNTNFICGNATYNVGQKITSKFDDIYTSIFATKISGGNKSGQIVDYTQEFKFNSSDADCWQSEFAFKSKLLCTGDVTLYYYKNNNWVRAEKRNFNTNITWPKIVPDAAINGWKYVVHCTLNINFDFLSPDNTSEDGYTLNQFTWRVKSSQQQQDDIQKSIEENTRNTNNLLGIVKNAIDNVKNAIDNVKNAIDDVVTSIANLPNIIFNGLKDLFIPIDFTNTLQDGLNDISDSLGVLGYPIQLLSSTLNTIINTSGESLSFNLPSFNYQGHVIFPGYIRSNIFYFGNNLVFANVNLVKAFTQFFDIFGIDCATVTISQFVKIIMRFLTGLGLISAIIHYYNNIFGTNIDVEGEDVDDDN